jgi:hypothetical protein
LPKFCIDRDTANLIRRTSLFILLLGVIPRYSKKRVSFYIADLLVLNCFFDFYGPHIW